MNEMQSIVSGVACRRHGLTPAPCQQTPNSALLQNTNVESCMLSCTVYSHFKWSGTIYSCYKWPDTTFHISCDNTRCDDPAECIHILGDPAQRIHISNDPAQFIHISSDKAQRIHIHIILQDFKQYNDYGAHLPLLLAPRLHHYKVNHSYWAGAKS